LGLILFFSGLSNINTMYIKTAMPVINNTTMIVNFFGVIGIFRAHGYY
jgi:hypothetical protein